MKKLILLAAICLSQQCLFAQARSTEVDYLKQKRPAVVNDVPFDSKTIENAIDDTFSKLGYKSTSSKGFTVYKGVRLPELGLDTYDLYFMVDKKSRRDKDNSTVTMMVSKGFDSFVSISEGNDVYEKSLHFLDSLKLTVAKYDLEQQIIAQEDELKKANKKSENLQDEGKDLEKKRKKLVDQIADNLKDQEKQLKEIDKQRQILEMLKGKRK